MSSPVFQKSEVLVGRVLRATEQFPRRLRGSLCRMIEESALDLDRRLTLAAFEERAGNRPGWQDALSAADREKAALARLLRVSRELGYLAFKPYEQTSEVLEEVGRLIGGWKKRGMAGTHKTHGGG